MGASGGRSALASVVGWLIVAIIVWVFFRGVFGTLALLLRLGVFLLIIGALLTLYFKLRDED